MDPVSPETYAPFKFVIVGGSIAGLTAALTLRQAGHTVLVLEKREPGIETRGGLRIPPNMSRLLETLPGARALLETYGTECSGMTFIQGIYADHPGRYAGDSEFISQGETVELLGRMALIEEVMSDLGCDFYMFPYDVLLKYLLDLCRDAGVEIRFRVEVSSVQLCANKKPAVVTIAGERIEADVLVGADGNHSIVRDIFLQHVEDEIEFDDGASDGSSLSLPPDVTKIMGGTCSIEVSTLKDDPELMELVSSNEFMIWAGTDLLVSGHRCGADLYIISLVRTNGEKKTDVDSDWHLDAMVLNEDDNSTMDEQEPRVKRLISHAITCHRTIQLIPKIGRLAEPSTSVVIIGDAAHTVPIHCTHNSSLAVEDGFALGRVFSHLTSRDQIPFLLNGYNEVRYRRTAATEASEISALIGITFPPGPARDARNQQFRAMSLVDEETEVADELIAATWHTYLVQFNYDANEAVDEWWLNWGKMMGRKEDECVEDAGEDIFSGAKFELEHRYLSPPSSPRHRGPDVKASVDR
ncbi:hypothetical protein B0H10DRAFT_2229753 [Mycena sp. CBHHK59/15]|nr:hypothetical protein B0H10DRAFT_2229753 [Mycena sp. CBHHK59/15]